MTAPKLRDLVSDYLPRIEAAARELADARELVTAATHRRNELITAAADLGISQQAVAKAAHISHPRLIKILSTPLDAEADDE